MRLKSVLICSASLCLLGAGQLVVAAPPQDRCSLPAGLRDEIPPKYPGTRVVSLADLSSQFRRKLFQEDHGTQCPGLVRVNFYGDGKPTWALVLIAGENPKRKAELIVAHQVGEDWEIRSLGTTDGTPVVWSEGPGDYDDLYNNKTIRATRPVIVFCGLESWTVVFAWTGKEVEKVQLSD
jgi:hypothetical protein